MFNFIYIFFIGKTNADSFFSIAMFYMCILLLICWSNSFSADSEVSVICVISLSNFTMYFY